MQKYLDASPHLIKIDVHLHAVFWTYEFNKFVDYTEQAKMFGKVTLSHALALGSLEEAAIRILHKKFIRNKGIGFDFDCTDWNTHHAIPTLVEQGVTRSPWLMTV